MHVWFSNLCKVKENSTVILFYHYFVQIGLRTIVQDNSRIHRYIVWCCIQVYRRIRHWKVLIVYQKKPRFPTDLKWNIPVSTQTRLTNNIPKDVKKINGFTQSMQPVLVNNLISFFLINLRSVNAREVLSSWFIFSFTHYSVFSRNCWEIKTYRICL